MTAESRVDQHSIQPVNLGLSLGLRHEGPQVQVLGVFHILVTKEKLINIKPHTIKYLLNSRPTLKQEGPIYDCVMLLDTLIYVCRGTFVILPPLKFAKRLSERVSTLELRWMVNLFEAVTIFLHLRGKKKVLY